MLADYHVHTEFSDDSDYPMEAVVQDALARGIDELCFTDHVDYGIKRDWDDPTGLEYRAGGPGEPELMPLANVDYPRYVARIEELREKYAGQISLKLGLEFGMQTHTIGAYEQLFRRYPFDFVILSVHQVEDKEFWNGAFQEGRTQAECYERYYDEMLSLVRAYRGYSVLGHMDLICRYDEHGPYPFARVRDQVAAILECVIADGRGIELNTSCWRYGLSDLTPSRDILRLYRELGGTVLTLGSDSHKPEHLGAHLADAKRDLLDLGFREFCTFDRMQPTFHSLRD